MVLETHIISFHHRAVHFLLCVESEGDREKMRGRDYTETGKIERNSPMCSSCGQVLTRHTVVWVKGGYINLYMG